MRTLFCLSLITLLLSFTSVRQNAFRISKIKTNLAVTEVTINDAVETDQNFGLAVIIPHTIIEAPEYLGLELLIQDPVLEIIKKINPSLNVLYLACSPPTLA